MIRFVWFLFWMIYLFTFSLRIKLLLDLLFDGADLLGPALAHLLLSVALLDCLALLIIDSLTLRVIIHHNARVGQGETFCDVFNPAHLWTW